VRIETHEEVGFHTGVLKEGTEGHIEPFFHRKPGPKCMYLEVTAGRTIAQKFRQLKYGVEPFFEIPDHVIGFFN
jgi:hypothetical protein